MESRGFFESVRPPPFPNNLISGTQRAFPSSSAEPRQELGQVHTLFISQPLELSLWKVGVSSPPPPRVWNITSLGSSAKQNKQANKTFPLQRYDSLCRARKGPPLGSGLFSLSGPLQLISEDALAWPFSTCEEGGDHGSPPHSRLAANPTGGCFTRSAPPGVALVLL